MIRLPGTRRSVTRRSAVAGAVLAALAMTGAAPAAAAPGHHSAPAVGVKVAVLADPVPIATVHNGLIDEHTHRCLDSNTQGAVYTNPCQVPGNGYQDWIITEWETTDAGGPVYFDTFQDRATGRCLDSNAAGSLYTNPCQVPGNQYQDWGFPAAAAPDGGVFDDFVTSLCLDSNIYGQAYTSIYNGGSAQIWDFTPW